MRLRWSWLVAAGALALLVAGLWQRREAVSPHGVNGAAPPAEPHPARDRSSSSGERSRSAGERPHHTGEQSHPARPQLRDPAGMTKAQLYEEAKRLGIPGRSQMSRDELLRAVLRARN